MIDLEMRTTIGVAMCTKRAVLKSGLPLDLPLMGYKYIIIY